MQTMRLLIVFALLAGLGYFGARQWMAPAADVRDLDLSGGCDIASAACTAQLPDGGTLEVSISPRPIPLMQTLQVAVTVRDSDLQPQQLDITGLNMEMGLNRTALQAAGPGRWQGETILPICSQRRMHWQAALMLVGEAGRYRLGYRFHTLRP